MIKINVDESRVIQNGAFAIKNKHALKHQASSVTMKKMYVINGTKVPVELKIDLDNIAPSWHEFIIKGVASWHGFGKYFQSKEDNTSNKKTKNNNNFIFKIKRFLKRVIRLK